MQKFVYYAPTEIVFGRGEETRAAELVQRYGGKRVFVIYGGNSAKKSGLLARIEENLRAAGLSVLSSGGVVPNPLVSTARRMVEEARAFQADFILAVGGGSVIDTAKGGRAYRRGARQRYLGVLDREKGGGEPPDRCDSHHFGSGLRDQQFRGAHKRYAPAAHETGYHDRL